MRHEAGRARHAFARRYGAVIVDLAARTCRTILIHPDARNGHVQYSRDGTHTLCVQVNDGIECDVSGNVTRLVGENGASLWVADDEGRDPRKLQVGSSLLERVQGHQCWIGGRHAIITTTHRREAVGRPWRQHWIVAIAPGDERGRIVADGSAQGVHFTHMHTTANGRYWVSDCNRTARVYVGSIRTGRFRRLCDSGASFGAAQYTHPHPFFLADDQTVGWNSDVTGVPHIYVARVPPGFLDELDRD